eukprot:5860904-Pleurochrysis_carterae.AAC.1
MLVGVLLRDDVRADGFAGDKVGRGDSTQIVLNVDLALIQNSSLQVFFRTSHRYTFKIKSQRLPAVPVAAAFCVCTIFVHYSLKAPCRSSTKKVAGKEIMQALCISSSSRSLSSRMSQSTTQCG